MKKGQTSMSGQATEKVDSPQRKLWELVDAGRLASRATGWRKMSIHPASKQDFASEPDPGLSPRRQLVPTPPAIGSHQSIAPPALVVSRIQFTTSRDVGYPLSPRRG